MDLNTPLLPTQEFLWQRNDDRFTILHMWYANIGITEDNKLGRTSCTMFAVGAVSLVDDQKNAKASCHQNTLLGKRGIVRRLCAINRSQPIV